MAKQTNGDIQTTLLLVNVIYVVQIDISYEKVSSIKMMIIIIKYTVEIND